MCFLSLLPNYAQKKHNYKALILKETKTKTTKRFKEGPRPQEFLSWEMKRNLSNCTEQISRPSWVLIFAFSLLFFSIPFIYLFIFFAVLPFWTGQLIFMSAVATWLRKSLYWSSMKNLQLKVPVCWGHLEHLRWGFQQGNFIYSKVMRDVPYGWLRRRKTGAGSLTTSQTLENTPTYFGQNHLLKAWPAFEIST